MAEQFRISKGEFLKRVEHTKQLAQDRGIDGLLVFSGYCEREGNVGYLVGHRIGFPYANVSKDVKGLGYSALVLPVGDTHSVLIAPFGYSQDSVVGVGSVKTGLNIVREVVDSIKNRGLNGRKIGVVGTDIVPVSFYEEIRESLATTIFEPADDILTNQRMIKSSSELKILRKSAEIAEKALTALDSLKAGMTEREIAQTVSGIAYDEGADYVARVKVHSPHGFQGIKWPLASERKVEKADVVYVDLIGWYHGYAFDVSRGATVGDPTEQQKRLFEASVQATDRLLGAMRPGVTPDQAISTALEFLESQDVRVFPFGHGIGIEVVELPFVVSGWADIQLKENMVLCIEPRIEIAGVGTMCVEQELVVTQDGPEMLTGRPSQFW